MQSFAHVSDRLYKLSMATKIQWNNELEDDFKLLKQKLLQQPIVRPQNLEQDFILETDASLVDVGAVL